MQGTRHRLVAQQDDPPQGRGARDRQVLRRLLPQARQQLLDHRQVVDGARAVGADQGCGVGLGHDVGHVPRPEAGVDRHQDGADLGDGEEREEVLRAVAQPQADVIAGLDTCRDQPPGDTIGLFAELSEGPATPLEAERLTVAPPLGCSVHQLAERQLVERHGGPCLPRRMPPSPRAPHPPALAGAAAPAPRTDPPVRTRSSPSPFAFRPPVPQWGACDRCRRSSELAADAASPCCGPRRRPAPPASSMGPRPDANCDARHSRPCQRSAPGRLRRASNAPSRPSGTARGCVASLSEASSYRGRCDRRRSTRSCSAASIRA
jgi:hypothetical protein